MKCLFLIPTFLNEESDENSIPQDNLKIIYSLRHFIVEREKTARAFLKKIRHPLPQSDFIFFELNEHTTDAELDKLLLELKKDHSIGLMSEAGMPCLADPGSKAVSYAHKIGMRVCPLSGPSSIILALTASGMNGQNFAFTGYLPVDKSKRQQRLRSLEKLSSEQGQTQIFIETPYRNHALLDEILRTCKAETRLCIACEILHPEREFIRTLPVKEWKKEKPDLNKKPAVFLLQA